MYSVDRKDKVVRIESVPQCDIGAPLPQLIADEYSATLIYITQNQPADWDGSEARVLSAETDDELIATVRFDGVLATMFGPPNDEAFNGHPLYERGLEPYSVFEVEKSSWIRGLVQMNSVHPLHSRKQFKAYKHFIFAFHDSTFECIAELFDAQTQSGSIQSVLQALTTT